MVQLKVNFAKWNNSVSFLLISITLISLDSSRRGAQSGMQIYQIDRWSSLSQIYKYSYMKSIQKNIFFCNEFSYSFCDFWFRFCSWFYFWLGFFGWYLAVGILVFFSVYTKLICSCFYFNWQISILG